jgi:S1-C subfamily serine protease/ATP-dependent Clp protease adapter protein ClpS
MGTFGESLPFRTSIIHRKMTSASTTTIQKMMKLPRSQYSLFRLQLFFVLAVSIVYDEAFGFSIGSPDFATRSSSVGRPMRTQLFSFSGTDIPLNVARLVQPSVALVTPKGVRNMTARGSGFVLDGFNVTSTTEEYTYIVTAAHVAAPGYAIELSLGDETYPAVVVARNVTLDLALLRTETLLKGVQGLTLAKEIPEVGTVAYAHGYPASRLRGPAMTSGIVCGIADGLGVPDSMSMSSRETSSTDETTFVVSDAAMSGGMSGGPLVDSNGNVLGVIALIRPDLRALGNYAVSAQELIGFLESISLNEEESSDNGYRVLLFNDPMNKKKRVSSVLASVASLDKDMAEQVMMQAHKTGRGIVGNYTDLGAAETMYAALRDEDLLVELERA